jgi:hypothetical protein
MFGYLSPEMCVRKDHPLCTIREMADEVLSVVATVRHHVCRG